MRPGTMRTTTRSSEYTTGEGFEHRVMPLADEDRMSLGISAVADGVHVVTVQLVAALVGKQLSERAEARCAGRFGSHVASRRILYVIKTYPPGESPESSCAPHAWRSTC